MIKTLTLFSALFLLLLSCSSQKKTASKDTPKELPQLVATKVTDTLIITTSDTPFREKPDINSNKWKDIPHYVVLKTYETVGNYYKVVLNDTVGYVPIAFVKKYTPEPEIEHPSSSNSSPTSYSSSSKGCSAVQCSGMTKKRAQCRNRTTNCSRRCYLH